MIDIQFQPSHTWFKPPNTHHSINQRLFRDAERCRAYTQRKRMSILRPARTFTHLNHGVIHTRMIRLFFSRRCYQLCFDVVQARRFVHEQFTAAEWCAVAAGWHVCYHELAEEKQIETNKCVCMIDVDWGRHCVFETNNDELNTTNLINQLFLLHQFQSCFEFEFDQWQ